MKSTSQSFIAVLFLLLMLAGISGYLLIKCQWHKKVMSKIESALHKDELQTFCFDQDQYKKLNWVDGKEFIMNKMWYDVVETYIHKDGHATLVVFADKEESEWFQKLFAEESADSKNTNRTNEKQILKFDLFPPNIFANIDCTYSFKIIFNYLCNLFPAHKLLLLQPPLVH